ncbi:R1 [Symbiodinium sp. CCMP2456]|nr:R1 [Symbiodinium sp. CCMP2456]
MGGLWSSGSPRQPGIYVDTVEADAGWMAFEITVAGLAGDICLHWGVGKHSVEEWIVPVDSQARTVPAAKRVPGALQTAFPHPRRNERKVRLEINNDAGLKGCQFVLHKKPHEWLKDGSRNFILDFSKVADSSSFRELVATAAQENPSAKVSCYSSSGIEVAILAVLQDGGCDVQAIVRSGRDLVLQYGLAGEDRRWTSSTRLRLQKMQGDIGMGQMRLEKDLNKYLMFVLHDPKVDQWLKDAGRDFAFKLPGNFGRGKPAKPQGFSGFSPVRLQRRASKLFSTFVEEVQRAEPDAKTSSWTVPGNYGLEVVVLGTAAETACNVHMLVHAKVALVVQYGLAGEDRAWKFSKRLPLVRAGTDKWEASFEISACSMEKFLMFVFHDGAGNRWIKHGPHDFEFEMPFHEDWAIEEALEAEETPIQLFSHLNSREIRSGLRAGNESAKKRLKGIDESGVVDKKIIEDGRKDRSLMARSQFLQQRPSRQSRADISFSAFELQGDAGSLDVSCMSLGDSHAKIEVRAWLHPRLGDCVMHFGVFETPQSRGWTSATEIHSVEWPSDMRKVDSQACQIPLCRMEDGIHALDLSLIAHVECDGSETLRVPDIGGLGFVLKPVTKDVWVKPNDGGDAEVRFLRQKPWRQFGPAENMGSGGGPWAFVAEKILSQEMGNHMSLKRRYENCLEFLEDFEKCSGSQMRRLQSWRTLIQIDSSKAVWSRTPSMPLIDGSYDEEEFWSWIFVWQRLSFQQFLTWERNINTQPRQLAAAINQLTQRLAELWKSTPSCRIWIRWTLSTMGRGGSAGQKIRDEILVIMHAHHIKEIHGTYYEQWHQKLHNNTTPADIGICRAIIAYLKSGGDIGVYWKVLAEHSITKEQLGSYSRPITTEPYMVETDIGRLIRDFERYLDILRSVHDALDLKLAVDHANDCLPGELQGRLYDVCNMGGTGFSSLDQGHGKFMRVAAARDAALAVLNDTGTDANVVKKLLVIDYILETQQSVLVQGMAETRLPPLVEQMRSLLIGLIGNVPLEPELSALLADWNSFASQCASRHNEDSALLLKALADRISRVVGDLCDKYQRMMGPKAAFLGEAVGMPRRNIDVFVDEVLRGTSLMAISLLLQRLEPVLRNIAQLPPWQIVSPVEEPIQGVFKLIDKMTGVQGEIFQTPTILLSGAVSGEEEVPDGVLGVLVRSAQEAPDILSHCAVRARNFKVLIATCFDQSISEQLAQDFAEKWVEVRCRPDGHLTVTEVERPSAQPNEQAVKEERERPMVRKVKTVKMNLRNDLGCSWCVRPEEMTKANVGSKSLNLALLKPKLPADSGIFTPQAMALPFGTMQKCLTAECNKDVLPVLEKVLGRLQPDSSNEEAQVIFEEAQQLVESMHFPEPLKKALVETMEGVGSRDGEDRLLQLFREQDAWQAIKGVWSSMFALRPWVSLAKAGRSFHDLNMAVLVQELVEAKYAFVLHTVNPFTKDKDELYGEIVAGRGETLVGNFSGRALSFAVRRGGEPRVLSYPSKSVALHTQPCLIFRSDSNAEDLEGFAGAGLFESVCAEEDKGGFQRLHRLDIVEDATYRTNLLKRIAEIGWVTEEAFDSIPQDIEGCVDVRDRIFLVQSRPQV